MQDINTLQNTRHKYQYDVNYYSPADAQHSSSSTKLTPSAEQLKICRHSTLTPSAGLLTLGAEQLKICRRSTQEEEH
jgi:hypothetical protein